MAAACAGSNALELVAHDSEVSYLANGERQLAIERLLIKFGEALKSIPNHTLARIDFQHCVGRAQRVSRHCFPLVRGRIGSPLNLARLPAFSDRRGDRRRYSHFASTLTVRSPSSMASARGAYASKSGVTGALTSRTRQNCLQVLPQQVDLEWLAVRSCLTAHAARQLAGSHLRNGSARLRGRGLRHR